MNNIFTNRFDAAFKFNSSHYLAQFIPSSGCYSHVIFLVGGTSPGTDECCVICINIINEIHNNSAVINCQWSNATCFHLQTGPGRELNAEVPNSTKHNIHCKTVLRVSVYLSSSRMYKLIYSTFFSRFCATHFTMSPVHRFVPFISSFFLLYLVNLIAHVIYCRRSLLVRMAPMLDCIVVCLFNYCYLVCYSLVFSKIKSNFSLPK